MAILGKSVVASTPRGRNLLLGLSCLLLSACGAGVVRIVDFGSAIRGIAFPSSLIAVAEAPFSATPGIPPALAGTQKLSFSCVPEPAALCGQGLAIDPRSGQLSWTPRAADSGRVFPVKVKISDGNRFEVVRLQIEVRANPLPRALVVAPDAPSAISELSCRPAESSFIGAFPADDTRIEWLRNGSLVEGLQGNTLPAGFAVRGDVVSCRAVASLEGVAPLVVESPATAVGNAAPTVESSVLPATALRTGTLSCTAIGASDPDADVLVVGYRWLVNGVPLVHSAPTLGLSAMRVGDKVSCEVIVSDGQLEKKSLSAEVVVANQAPLAAAALSAASALPSESLTCLTTGSLDPDEGELTFLYKWYKGDVPIAEENGASLALAALRHGDLVSCEVAVSDPEGGTASARSGSAVILNREPLPAASLSPLSPTMVTTLTCDASASRDDDGDTLSYSYRWTRNGQEMSGRTASTLPGGVLGVGDSVACRVTARDGFGGEVSVMSPARVVVNRLPLAQAAITTTPLFNSSPIECSSAGSSDPDGELLTYSFAWYLNGTTPAHRVVGQTSATLPANVAHTGDSVRCEVSADDGHDSVRAFSSPVIIANRAPVAAATLNPAAGNVDTSFSCLTVGSQDPDGHALSFSYRWLANGDPVANQTAVTLPPRMFAAQASLRCEVTASDGHGGSHTQLSEPVVIANRAPVAVASVSTGPVFATLPVLCSPTGSADPDGDALSYSYAWFRNGIAVGERISGETSSSLTPRKVVVGDTLRCQVTVEDPFGISHSAFSEPVTVANRLPVAQAAVLPMAASASTTLTCASAGSADPDEESLTFSYRWYKNGATPAHLLAGQTTASLLPEDFVPGDGIYCDVTATDPHGASHTAISSVNVIGNHAPVAVSSIVTSPVYVSTPVVCSSAGTTDEDVGDVLTIGYTWKVNGDLKVGQVSSTLPVGQFANGDTLKCVVTANDGKGGIASVESTSVAVTNRAPVAQASITTSPAYNTTALTCSAAGSTDADGDTITYTYAWKKGGAAIAGQNAATLPVGQFANGDSVECVVMANDGHSGTHTATSAAVVIANRAPVAQAGITTSPAYNTTALTCSAAGSVDDDGDTLTFTYAWKKGGATLAGQNGATLPVGQFANGDSVECLVTANDGHSGSHTATSAAVTIQNRAPVAQAAITTSPAYNTTALTCSAAGSADADSDTLTFTYAWKKGGASIAGQNAATLPVGQFANGDSVECLVTADDGRSGTHTATSAAVVIANRAPVAQATITTSPAYNTTALTCSAAGSADADSDTLTYTYAWKKGGVSIAGQNAATLPVGQFANGDSVECLVTANDGRTGTHTATSAAVLIANRAPVAAAAVSPVTAYNDTILTCVTTGTTDADGDGLTYSYVWRMDGSVLVGRNAATLGAGNVLNGSQVLCEVTVSDGHAGSAFAQSAAITISNRAPVAQAVITTSPAYNTTALTCSAAGSADADGDALSFTYAWRKGGATIADQNGATLPLGQFTNGDSVQCLVTANDGRTGTHTATSASITIANRAPVAQASITTSPAYNTTSLTCSAAGSADADGDTLTYTYAWKKGGASIAGQNAATLPVGQFANGDSVECLVTANDGRTGTHTATSVAVVIANRAPVAHASITTSPAYNTTALTCSADGSVDDDGDTLTYTYAWKKGGASIAGQNAATLPVGQFANGDSVECLVTVNDGHAGSHSATSAGVTIQNRAPVAQASITTSPAYNTTALTCSAAGSADADGDALTYTYAWKKGGEDISGQNAATLPVGQFGNGDSVQCLVTANDGRTGTHTATSAAVVIANRAPAAQASITTSPAYNTMALTCSAAGSTDADGDALSFTYAWKKGGATIAEQNGATLPVGQFGNGDSVECVVTANDGRTGIHTATSAAVIIANRAPVAQAAITTIPAYNTTALSCSAAGSADADGDVLTFTYAWKKGGTNIAGQNGATLPVGQFANGDSLECMVTANDGHSGSHTATSAAVFIANRAPVAAAAVNPVTAYNDTLLACVTTGTADADGDTLSFTYVWRMNGNVISSQNGSTLAGGIVANGSAVACEVTVSDGHGGTAFVQSSARTITNRAPTAAAAITTNPAYNSTALTCSAAGSVDPDGDALTFTYAWRKGGVAIGGETSATLPVGQFANGDSVECLVTADDGRAGTHTATSSVVTIANRAPHAVAVITTIPAYNTTPLTCSSAGSSDLDGDTLTYTYAWKKGGIVIAGQTASTLPVGQFANGNSVECVVTANDGRTTHTTTSEAVTIANRAPVVQVTITTSPAYSTTDLVCSFAGSFDPDGDTTLVTFVWTKGGVTISGQNASVLPTGQFGTGDVIVCAATATDTWSASSSASSAPVTIANRAPTAVATLNSLSPTKADTLTCSPTGSNDLDGHTLTYTYAWFRNGTTLGGAASSTLPLAVYSVGDTIACQVTATDSFAGSHTATSSQATIQNRAPTSAASVKAATTTTPWGEAEQNIINLRVNLLCDTTGSSDPDGDALTFTYQWRKNGTTMTNETAQTLARTKFGPRDQMVCLATASDGRTGTHTATSASVTIPNANHDFDGDGVSDLFWQNNANPFGWANAVWHLNSAMKRLSGSNAYNNVSNTIAAGGVSAGWYVAGQGDFDGDTRPDLYWVNSSAGSVCIWFGGGLDVTFTYKWKGQTCSNNVISSSWYANGVVDFNNDGHPDVLWHNTSNGQVIVWEMNGYAKSANGVVNGTASTPWYIYGAGDVDGNGSPDILLRYHGTDGGMPYFWMMNGYNVTSSVSVGNNPGLTWDVTGLMDINNDNRPEILWQQCSSGSIGWWTLGSNGVHTGNGGFPRASDNVATYVQCADYYMRSR